MTFELDTKALRYFTAVARRGSFSLAATQLRITQPAVSRQIQAIEKAYGVRLFRREGRSMALTEAGNILLEQASDLIEQLDKIDSLIKAAAIEPVGRISVGVTTSPAEILMPEVIQRYRLLHPQVFVHVVQASSAELKDQLSNGKLDLALIYSQPTQGGATAQTALTLKPLVDLPIGLVAPPASALKGIDPLEGTTEISLERAAQLPLIFPGPSELLRGALQQACARLDITPNVVLESESLLLTKALIKAGMAYMLVAQIGVHDEVRQGTLRFIPLTGEDIIWRLSLALRGTKAPSLAVRTMAEEITAAVRRGVKADAWGGRLLV